ncbi:MAG: glutaredoxin family protein [Brevinematales bacterium]|jgi:glutaredoxin
MKDFQRIDGKDKGKVTMYALSTCVWCKKTKKLLQEMGVNYSYIDMDQLDDEVKDKYIKELKNWNPSCSYPTLVINDRDCIVGFEEEKIREALK